MKKTLIAAVSLILLTPSIALAAWWNPFTWFPPKVAPQIIATSSVATTSISIIATTTPKVVQKKIIPVPSSSKLPISNIPTIKNQIVKTPIPTISTTTVPRIPTPTPTIQTNSQTTQSPQTTTVQNQQQTTTPVPQSNSIAYTSPQRFCIDPGSGELGLGSLQFSSVAGEWTINYTATSNSSLRNQDIMTQWGFGSFSLVDYPTGSFDRPGDSNISYRGSTGPHGTSLTLDNPVVGSDVVLTITSATDENGNLVNGLPITLDTGTIQSCQSQ